MQWRRKSPKVYVSSVSQNRKIYFCNISSLLNSLKGNLFVCLFLILVFLSWELTVETMELQHTNILHTILSRQKGLRLGIEDWEEKGMVLNLTPYLNHLQEVGKSMRFGYSDGWFT